MSSVRPAFVLYIDEAGDPGVKARSAHSSKAHEWFVLGGVLIKAERDREAIDWLKDMREAIRAQSPLAPIHYRNLSDPNRERVCRMLGRKPVRLFSVASHKKNMRGYQNKKLGSGFNRGAFYNWCIRLLLERASAWVENHSIVNGIQTRSMQIVFSERGGHDYEHLFSYLRTLNFQRDAGTTHLSARVIRPGTIDVDLCEVRPHNKVAGLQLADICASAIFQGLVSDVPRHSIVPALQLKERVAIDPKSNTRVDFGLTLWPKSHQGEIPSEDRELLKAYGFKF